MRYWLYAAILAVAASGCRNPDAEFNAELDRELTAVNAALKKLSEKIQPGKILLPPRKAGEEPRELQLLPADPTPEEVVAYAKAVHDLLLNDLPPSVLVEIPTLLVGRIPPGHIPLLGDYMAGPYFREKVTDWLLPGDKERILAALPDSPPLLSVLLQLPVTAEEIREPILRMLEKNPQMNHGPLQSFFPILLDDAVARERLIRIVVAHPEATGIGDNLTRYGEFKDIFLRMWEYAVAHELEIPPALMLRAMSSGSVEALGRWIHHTWPPEQEYQRKWAFSRAPFLKNQADPAAFFDAHRDAIVFNPESKQFELRESAP